MGYNNSFFDTVAGQDCLHALLLSLREISDSLEVIAKYCNNITKEEDNK